MVKNCLYSAILVSVCVGYSAGRNTKLFDPIPVGYNQIESTNCNPKDDIHIQTQADGTSHIQECADQCDSHNGCVAFVISPWADDYYQDDVANCWLKRKCDQFERDFSLDTFLRVSSSDNSDCYFEAAPGYALFGFNNKRLDATSAKSCEKQCLNMGERCKSFDLAVRPNRRAKVKCYLSSESRDTQSQFYGKKEESTYYHKVCGDNNINY